MRRVAALVQFPILNDCLRVRSHADTTPISPLNSLAVVGSAVLSADTKCLIIELIIA